MPIGAKYVYKVKAVSSTGHESGWSNEVSIIKHGVAKIEVEPGTYKDAQPWVKVNGVWQKAAAYAREDTNSDWAASKSI